MMKVAGFTFVRNAVRFDYPVVESILSILSLCDEFIVALGNSEDGTRDLIASIRSPKIRIIDTQWNDSLRAGGRTLALETEKALGGISSGTDWAFYLQADEVVHEQYLPVIRRAMEQWCHDKRVEGLLFRYLHFWGLYEYVGTSRNWYRNEVRIVRPGPGIQSWKDAQGFRIQGRKLRVVSIPAYIFHYGCVKPPALQQAKQESFNRYWHDDDWIKKHVADTDQYDYSVMDMLRLYEGTHLAVMADRIARKDWEFKPESLRQHRGWVRRILHWFEYRTGIRIGEYRNYVELRNTLKIANVYP